MSTAAGPAVAETAFQVDMTEKLKELQKWVSRTEDDLRARSAELPEVHQRLQHDYQQARESERTLETFESWRDEYLTQVAVGWVLTSVFLRFLEDNALISEVWLAGPGDRLQLAREHRSHYFQQNPAHTDREYLQAAFRSVAQLPGCQALFGEERNPLWLLGPSGDLAKEMIAYWQEIEPATGELKRIFGSWSCGRQVGSCGRRDGADRWQEGFEQGGVADTRFLGDLYQDLSEAARKRFALLQTPDFVEEFILDKTLEPALETFGLDEVRLLDPTCGSGHFLLGGFARLLDKRHRQKPNEKERERVQKALDGVYGVDLNPFAVAIARFRLLVAALNACGITKLKDAPNFQIHVAAGDSLLHGRQFGRGGQGLLSTDRDWLPDAFATGDFEEATRILSRQYHAVVGNPPYIVDKDKAHNAEVRERYSACHRQFSLAVPFKELFFDKCVDEKRSGFVGMITANSFMKREFGKKLIEEFFPLVDLTHVIDTSGAYIPGHGTPTVILFGRNREPKQSVVKAALGIRGEPSTPDDPAQGKVWRSIVDNIDKVEAENDFITIANMEREKLHQHPWALAGGGASELKELIEGAAVERLDDLMQDIGRTTHSGEDPVFYLSPDAVETRGLADVSVPLITGEDVRDWMIVPQTVTLFPYKVPSGQVLYDLPQGLEHQLWPFRTRLKMRKDFGNFIEDRGLKWYEHSMFFPKRFQTPLSITFAFVATHNHFVLDRGGKVFNRSAPVIKLPPEATEDDHLALLGLLNSSVWEFWAQQVSHNKGGPGGGSSKDEKWHDFYERDGTKMARTPIPPNYTKLLLLATKLDELGLEAESLFGPIEEAPTVNSSLVSSLRAKYQERFRKQVALQEELDWLAYTLFEIVNTDLVWTEPYEFLPLLSPGERAFEIVLAQQIEDGDVNTRWFERPERQYTTVVSAAWPSSYQRLVHARVEEVKRNRLLRLVESTNCKRRWELEPFENILQRKLQTRLLNRIESLFSSSTEPALTTTARLADRLSRDEDFLQVARLYTGQEDFDLTKLVTELATKEDVPYLCALRYKATGLRKRAQWEKTWDLQRREDAGEKVGKIPVPPKYASTDFAKTHYWTLRGKLDVPKERFLSYPLAERSVDPSPVLGWAGWNHLDQAKALATYYLERKEQDGWTTEQLTPLLAGLQELIPWLKQWHNEIDPDFDQPLGDFYQGFLEFELRHHNLTPKDLTDWRPPGKGRGAKKK